jgi:Na+:H+ antiporter, NhaA family
VGDRRTNDAPHASRHPSIRRGRNQRNRWLTARASEAAGHVVRFLRTEQIGGLILLAATATALIVANSGASAWYTRFINTAVGPESLHLHLTLEQWATDGLLTLFFVVVGLELKHELVVGELRDPRRAILPIFAAVGGMVIPAVVALAVGAGSPGIGNAWPVPVATDIAFALGVLAIVGRDLPSSLRVFLLTLAIVDDLGAIVLIAVLFTDHFSFLPLLGAIAAIAVYALLQRIRFRGWWLYLILAVVAWALLHASGVHATLAGVAIGLATRVKPDPGEHEAPAEKLEHTVQPISAGICVPLFAFMAAGVSLSATALRAFVHDRTALAVLAGLVIGKTIGVFGGCLIAVGMRLGTLPPGLNWRDLFAVSVLTGCGFTVSLLIAELAFEDPTAASQIKIAVLAGSLLASLLAALLLRRRVRARIV